MTHALCPCAATKEERLQSLRQRRQSRYVTPPPPVDRTTAAEKLEAQWKKEAAVNEVSLTAQSREGGNWSWSRAPVGGVDGIACAGVVIICHGV